MLQTTPNILTSGLLLLCEQVEKASNTPKTPEHYINIVVKWLVEKWASVKKLVAQNIMDIASGKVVKISQIKKEQEEALVIDQTKKNLIQQSIDLLLKDMAAGAVDLIADVKKQVTRDLAGNYFQYRTTPAGTLISGDWLRQAITGLDFQKDFVDDFNLSTQQRVSRLLEARYGSLSDLREQVDHTLRIGRDNLLEAFHADVDDIANRLVENRLTPVRFQEEMEKSITRHYRKMYRAGKGVPLEDWEKEFLAKQVQGQKQYLDNFRDYVQRKRAMGEDLTSYVNWRAGLYSERGSALYEAGWVNSMDATVMLDWVLQPAEHCETCPAFAAASPFTRSTLPGFPGEGFHLTQCGTNCKCLLEISRYEYR